MVSYHFSIIPGVKFGVEVNKHSIFKKVIIDVVFVRLTLIVDW